MEQETPQDLAHYQNGLFLLENGENFKAAVAFEAAIKAGYVGNSMNGDSA